MTTLRALSLCVGMAAATALLPAQTKNLDIYFVDTEGGAATLIVTPTGESLLADSGNPGDRDAERIVAAAKAAGLTKIDMLVTSHFHGDHVGGAASLTKMFPVMKFYDHGDSVETSDNAKTLFASYKAMTEGKRVSVKPGDKIPLNGMDVTVVSANGDVLGNTINGDGANPFCKDVQNKDADRGENGRSLGFLLTYGKFKFADLGDLTWDREMSLACPTNRIGEVTVLQATHHGFINDTSGNPAMVWASKPQVIVANNGPRKGMEMHAWETMSKSPSVEGIWQLHQALKNEAAQNTSADMIANVEETADCKGNWIKLSVSADGKYTVTNSRNNFSKTYTAR